MSEATLDRLRQMGLEVEELPGCARVTLPLSGEPLEGSDGPLPWETVVFATVGADRIKCLEPRPLFHLPLVSIQGCTRPADFERRIHDAWVRRRLAIGRAEDALGELGARPGRVAEGAALTLPVGDDDDDALAICFEHGRWVLPGRGPLSGLPLERAEDRLFPADPSCASALELEIALTTRLEELARAASRRAERRRLARRSQPPPTLVARRSRQILLVGPHTGRDRRLLESLRLRGHRIASATSMREALVAFQEHSFELVLADAELDRAEGAELLPALRDLPGIDYVPVVVVDDRSRPARREAARHLGAAGYVVRPLDVERIEGRLQRLLDVPRRRRFTRYPRHLAVRFGHDAEGAHTALIGRGGMLLRTPWTAPVHTLDRFEISLPETRTVVQVDAEVVYQLGDQGRSSGDLGLRFEAFPPGHERILIDYLAGLEAA